MNGPDGNFGDYLTHVLVEDLFGYKTKRMGVAACDLVGVGSLLEIVQGEGELRHPVIWGTGFIQDGPDYTGDAIDVAAVRGQLTHDRLKKSIDTPVPLGDPGLLVGRAFPEVAEVRKRYKLGVIPHYIDHGHPAVSRLVEEQGVALVNVLGHPQAVATAIAECEAVVSSSLHGLIVADALGVPNAWMPLSDKVIGGDYKFRDYYSAFGRVPQPVVVASADDLLRRIESTWKPVPDLNQIQDDLIEAFPAPVRSRTHR